MKSFTIKAIFLFALFLHFFLKAQNERFMLESYTTEEGLSHNYVNCIVQDSTGFIWAATHNGLNRFDGHQFKSYFINPRDTNSIGFVHIETLLKDKNGNLWLGGLNGVDRYDKKIDRFYHVSSFPACRQLLNVHVKALLEDFDGNIWIGTYGTGLFRLNPETFEIKSYRQNGIASISSDYINALYQEKPGELWIGTKQGGLNRLEIATEKFDVYKDVLDKTNSDITISSIEGDEHGNLWLGTWGKGLFRYNKSSKVIEKFNPLIKNKEFLENTSIVCVKRDHEGFLWAATFDHGVVVYDPITKQAENFRNEAQEPFHIKSNITWNIFEDQFGVIWVSSFGGGMIKIVKKNKGFSHIAPATSSFITSVFQTHNADILIGTTSKGLAALDEKRNTIYTKLLSSVADEYSITCIAEDRSKNLWMGTGKGAIKVNATTGMVDHIDPSLLIKNSNKNFKSPAIISISVDHEGFVWMGSFEGGLFKYDPQTKSCLNYSHDDQDKNSLSNDVVWSIFEDDQFNLWLGTRHLLNRYDRQKNIFVKYIPDSHNPHSISHNIISQIFQDSKKNIWIATLGGGFNRYRRETDDFVRIDQKQGLPEGHVLGMIEDNKGNFWLSTTKKICKYDIERGKMFIYDKSSGLEENIYNMNACLKSRSGQIYFGGSNGITVIHPDSVSNFLESPPIVLTDFKRFNESVGVGQAFEKRVLMDKEINEIQTLVLDYNDYVISFEFSILDFAYPSANNFAYQLEGFDKKWINTTGKARTAYYTNLSPGEYTLRIKATNHTGIWNPLEKRLKIIVEPPFWQTLWFKSLIGLLLIGTTHLIVRARINSLKRQRRILKKLVRKKTERILSQKEVLEKKNKELSNQKEEILAQRNEILEMSLKVQEADQRKTKFFTNVSHEFRTPLTLILGPLENLTKKKYNDPVVENSLQVVYKNATRLLHLVNEIMDFQKIDNGQLKLNLNRLDIVSFCKELIASFKEIAEDKQIQLNSISNLSSFECLIDASKIEVILYNLVSNAFKFTSPGGQILTSIHVNQSEDMIRIVIEDNGIGIEESELPYIFDRYYHIENPGLNKEGSGIGLAYSKELIDLMNGKISVQSELGKGSRFFIDLPIVTHSEKVVEECFGKSSLPFDDLLSDCDTSTISVKPEANLLSSSKRTLLVVEDNEELRKFIKASLVEKYFVEEASNGEEGLKLAKEKSPALIITDIMMPIMSGMELCSSVKSDIEISHIPVILLTARAGLQSQIEGFETGADEYIVKPFSQELLLVRVENLLRNRDMLKQKYKSNEELQATCLSTNPLDEKFLIKALELVEENLDNPNFGSSELVKGLAMSRTTVHIKFKELTSLSTGEFIRVTRLKHAAKILREQKIRVSEVSYMVGFTDPNYFSKAFRALYGVSPTQFSEKIGTVGS